jgi:hypothetical protein
MKDVERFDPCFGRKVDPIVDCIKQELSNLFEDKNIKYGFFVSLNMENFKATKNWRKFCGKCIMKNCFIFERICYSKKDKSYITEFEDLFYNKKENFLDINTEFLIFCGEKEFNFLAKEVESYVIEKDLNIVNFETKKMQDLALSEEHAIKVLEEEIA